jgi:hypothetical protein
VGAAHEPRSDGAVTAALHRAVEVPGWSEPSAIMIAATAPSNASSPAYTAKPKPLQYGERKQRTFGLASASRGARVEVWLADPVVDDDQLVRDVLALERLAISVTVSAIAPPGRAPG